MVRGVVIFRAVTLAMLFSLVLGCAGSDRPSQADALLRPPEDQAPPSWQPEKANPNHLALARDLVHQGYYTVAMGQLTRVIKEKGDASEPHCLLGVCHRETGDLSSALKSFQRAISLDKAYAPAYSGLGITYFMKNQYPLARKAMEKAVALNPASADYHNNLGVLEMRQNCPKAALSRFTQCLRIDPGHARAKNNMAECLVRLGRDGAALAFLKQQLPPATACNNLGVVYLTVGQPVRAQKMFRRALAHDPSLAAARRNLNRMEKREDPTP